MSELIMSKEAKTRIYHKPSCPHAKRMKPENYMALFPYEIKRLRRARPCKCCNNMKHQFETEWKAIEHYERAKDMQFKLVNGILYVKTPIGCWKIVYVKSTEQVVLYHRNSSPHPVDFEHPEREKYHLQKDVKKSYLIVHYLEYIYKHDRFRQEEASGHVVQFSKKKYQRQAAKRKWRNSVRRVDQLFAMLESQDRELVKESCW